MTRDEIKKFILRSLSLICFLYINIALFALIVTFVLKFVFTEVEIIEIVYSRANNLYLITSLMFIFGAVGWIASYNMDEVKFVSPLSIPRKEFITLLVSSFFFARFYIDRFVLLPFNGLSLTVMTALIFTLLTQIVNQLSNASLKNYHAHVLSTLSMLKQFKVFTSIIAIGGVFILCLFVINGKSQTIDSYNNLFRQSLIITSVEPKKTTLAHNVSIIGHNFGTIKTNKHKLMSSYGQTNTQSWTENRIDFVVPLDWREGNVDLWVERPVSTDNKTIYVSNKMGLTILSRWDFYPIEGEGVVGRVYKKIIRHLFLK